MNCKVLCILYGLRYIIVVLGDTPKLSFNGRMINALYTIVELFC